VIFSFSISFFGECFLSICKKNVILMEQAQVVPLCALCGSHLSRSVHGCLLLSAADGILSWFCMCRIEIGIFFNCFLSYFIFHQPECSNGPRVDTSEHWSGVLFAWTFGILLDAPYNGDHLSRAAQSHDCDVHRCDSAWCLSLPGLPILGPSC